MITPARMMTAGKVLFVGSLLVGVGGTVIGMIQAFGIIQQSQGQVQAEDLAASIRMSMHTTMAMGPFTLLGLCLLVVGGIGRYSTREGAGARPNAGTE